MTDSQTPLARSFFVLLSGVMFLAFVLVAINISVDSVDSTKLLLSVAFAAALLFLAKIFRARTSDERGSSLTAYLMSVLGLVFAYLASKFYPEFGDWLRQAVWPMLGFALFLFAFGVTQFYVAYKLKACSAEEHHLEH